MASNQFLDPWMERYSHSHRHPVNRICHAVGIPMIVVSLVLFAATFVVPVSWMVAVALFILGWALQLAGHWIEGKPPAFLNDWRFLFVGLRWWLARLRGRV
jgi:uncharacterized membrane protein YGL010W